VFDVSTVLLPKRIRDDVTIHYVMTPARLSVTPRCISSLRREQSLLLFKQTVDDLYLPIFRYTAAVDFIQQPIQIGFAQCVMLKFTEQSSKAKSGLH